MWARLELGLRGGLAQLGTAPVSLALLALAAVAAIAGEVWERAGSPAAAHAFATSLACEAIAAALLVDAAVALYRALPLDLGPSGGLRLALEPRSAAPIALRAAQLLAALAFAASLTSREGFEVRIAEGEAFTGSREQLLSRDAPRRFSSGLSGIRFAVKEVRASPPGTSGGEPVVAIRAGQGEVRTGSRSSPIWLGWGRFLRPIDAGWALRYELSGGVIPAESAFAKLKLLPPGKSDSIRMTSAPYRIFVRLASEQPPPWTAPALELAVHRGPLLVAEGLLAPGNGLVFEGGVLRFPEARRWVTFRALSDPGIPLAVLAAALAAVGIALLGGRGRGGAPSGAVRGSGESAR